MLPYKNRVHERKDFKTIFSARKSIKKENIVFWYDLKQTKNSKFAVVVTTKFSKSSVARNKLRRQMRDVLEKEILGSNKKIQGIFVVSSKKQGMTYKKIKEAMLSIFKDLGV